MTNRERLLNILDGQPTDRVPIWLLFPYHDCDFYADVRNNPCYTDIFEASKTCAIMLDRRPVNLCVFTPDVRITHEQVTENGGRIDRKIIAWKGESLCEEITSRADGTTVKRAIHTEQDLELFCSLPINTDEALIRQELDEWLPQLRQETAEFPLEYGAMMIDAGEPINDLYHNANLLEFPIWSLTQADQVKTFLDAQFERLNIVYTYLLEHDVADVYFMVGSELASPPMVSRKTFQNWIVPYARDLIALIHSYGKKVIQHYHGQIKTILPDFLTMAPDGLHTIEAPPVGNCTFTEAFDIVGDNMTLIGNIQYDCFRSYTPAEMEQAVKDVIDECRGQRLILSPSAGPYEDIISEQMIQNYLQFMHTGYEYGKQ